MISELSRCANEILTVSADSQYSDTAAARRTVAAACSALRTTLEELRPGGRLSSAVRLLQARWRDHQEETRVIVSDANLFLNVFLQKEIEILRRAELRPEVIKVIAAEAETVRRDISNLDFSPEDLHERLAPLTHDVCRLHERFVDYVNPTNPSLIERAGWIAAGAIIIGSNATVDAVMTAGMIPAATAVSGAFGGHVITKRL